MSNMQFTLSIDKKLASKTQQVLSEIGIDMNYALQALLKMLVNKEVSIISEPHQANLEFNKRRKLVMGKYTGKIWLDAFDEPLDCMKEYMLTDEESENLRKEEVRKPI